MLATGIASYFEAGMLICFGVGWPVSIFKTLRTKHVSGKSLGFLILIFIGYVSGIGAKIARAAGGEGLDWVIALYALNGLMVAIEIVLYAKYSPREPVATLGPEDVPVE